MGTWSRSDANRGGCAPCPKLSEIRATWNEATRVARIADDHVRSAILRPCVAPEVSIGEIVEIGAECLRAG